MSLPGASMEAAYVVMLLIQRTQMQLLGYI